MDNTFAAAKGSIFAHITPGPTRSASVMQDTITDTLAVVSALGVSSLSEPDLFAIVNTVRPTFAPLTNDLYVAAWYAVTRFGVIVPDTFGRGTVSARVFAALAKR